MFGDECDGDENHQQVQPGREEQMSGGLYKVNRLDTIGGTV